MPFEYPLMQSLLTRLDIDNVKGWARVLPNYELELPMKVVSVSLYSKDFNYLVSLSKGVLFYLQLSLKISIHQLPMFSYSSNDLTFFSQSSHIYEIKLASKDIEKLCGIFNMDFSYVYRECEPRVNRPNLCVKP